MTYPLFGGSLDFGAEYINTNRQDDYVNPQNYVTSTYSTLKEQSISPYAEYSILMPKIGQFRMGLRYEHVNFDYYESGHLIEGQSRSYSNLYPSFSFGTQIGKVMAQISYSAKTTRPTYRELSNDVFYGNRYTLQQGNPLLDNSILHNISVQGMWKFLQFSFNYSDERGRIIHWMEQHKCDLGDLQEHQQHEMDCALRVTRTQVWNLASTIVCGLQKAMVYNGNDGR